MPTSDYIQVSVVVNGEALKEYQPSSPLVGSESDSNCFIQADRDQAFTIEAIFMRGFDLRGASGLVVQLEIDGLATYNSFYSNLSQRHSSVLTEEINVTMDGTAFLDPVTQCWKAHPFTFAEIDDDKHTTSVQVKTSDRIPAKLGSISVSCWRSQLLQKCFPARVSKPCDSVYKMSEIDVDEKDIKKRQVRYGNGEACTPPLNYKWRPVSGPAGKPMRFTFFYRHEETLKAIGCFPDARPLPPDFQLILQRQENLQAETKRMLRETMLEVEDLKKRLVFAESDKHTSADQIRTNALMNQINRIAGVDNDNNTSTGASSNSAESNKHDAVRKGTIKIKSETAMNLFSSSIKRHRASEATDDEITEIPSPPKKPRVIVELE